MGSSSFSFEPYLDLLRFWVVQEPADDCITESTPLFFCYFSEQQWMFGQMRHFCNDISLVGTVDLCTFLEIVSLIIVVIL